MAEANVAPSSGWDPRRFLEGAEAHGYPRAATARLRDASNTELAKVWAWLDKLDSPIDRFHFIVAALRGLAGPMMRDDLRRRPKRARENLAFQARFSKRSELIANARQGGQVSDYLRGFVGELLDFDFPIEASGTQAQIARTANAVLGLEGVTRQQVSAILKTARRG